jgi:hypothetical protein
MSATIHLHPICASSPLDVRAIEEATGLIAMQSGVRRILATPQQAAEARARYRQVPGLTTRFGDAA